MLNIGFIFLTFILMSSHVFSAILPAGTEIKVRVEEKVNTQIRPVGYRVRAIVATAIEVDNKTVVKQDAKAQLTITKIQVATRERSAGIELTLTNLTIGNRAINVSSYPVGG
ncbi:hypothetical protein N8878_05410 [Psychromonas sp.]|nr:hypothetical protein [Psychromonas sp.]